jgi:hypothetical protein
MTAVFYDIYLFSILTLFKILGCATSSYVGSVLKKTCQKLATVDKGLKLKNNTKVLICAPCANDTLESST